MPTEEEEEEEEKRGKTLTIFQQLTHLLARNYTNTLSVREQRVRREEGRKGGSKSPGGISIHSRQRPPAAVHTINALLLPACLLLLRCC